MDAIVRQTIPAAVIDNPRSTGRRRPAPSRSRRSRTTRRCRVPPRPPATTREADVRYARWKGLFDAEREVDRFTPDFPTFIDRSFEIEREIPEAEVEQLLRAVLEAPVGARVPRR